jgi:hypothetical protein
MDFTVVNNITMKNKDQKSLESIYESIKIVKENEDEFEGGASFEGEGRGMGNIDGVTPEVGSEPLDDVQDEEEEGAEGISRDELDELLAGLDSPEGEEESESSVPADIASDMAEDEF